MKRAIWIVALLCLLSACAPTSPRSVNEMIKNSDAMALTHRATLIKQPIEPLDNAFVRGINDFGFDAAARLYRTDNNLALSPASIELALCMTREGAAGETAAEMTQALKLSGLTDKQITDACRMLMWRANTGGMEAANAIWLSSVYTFADEFVSRCTGDYMADAFPLIIPGAMDAINAWANGKTHGRIGDIIKEELNGTTRIVLTNALFYLGEWTLPFEANDTHKRDFHSPSGDVAIDFMHSERYVPYYQNDDFSMISLKFKSDEDEGQYAMTFLLPNEDSDLNALLSLMNANTFDTALNEAASQQVFIRLPKFEFLYDVELKETLIDMGMSRAFDDTSADFSPMTVQPNQLVIEKVLHKCYIRIDELGAEAAAVTAVIMEDGAAAPSEIEPIKFYADRPFLFAIYSLEDGAIAFIGAVNDPAK